MQDAQGYLRICKHVRALGLEKKIVGGPFLGTPIIRIQDNSILVGIILGGVA